MSDYIDFMSQAYDPVYSGASYDPVSSYNIGPAQDYSSYYTQPNFNLPDYGAGNYATPSYDSGYQAPSYSGYPYSMDYAVPDLNFNSVATPGALGTAGIGGGPVGTGEGSGSSMLGSLGSWLSQLSPDKQVGLGMGLFNGIGSAMAAKQSNKYAKKASKYNDAIMQAQLAALNRQKALQAKTDPYNYSVDTTTPGSFAYHPLSAEQAAHYGETGAPHQQMFYTPGETTRTPLAGGGEVKSQNDANHKLQAMRNLSRTGGPLGQLSDAELLHFLQSQHSSEVYGMPNTGGGMGNISDQELMQYMQHMHPQEAYQPPQGYAHGGMASCPNCGGMAGSACPTCGGMGGQADNVPAMLSEGEYVMPADVVAALGDGNTKAGASALDQMRHHVRAHARSAAPNKLPPKAKPAVAYLPKKGK